MRSKLGHYCAKIGHSWSKHWPKAWALGQCHPRNSWLSNKDISLNLHTADRNLFNNGHCAVLMKSNYLTCQTQHHILIKTVKRYMTQIENSLTAPCWHHVWRESRCKALWVNMAVLCAKRPVTKSTFIPRIGNFFMVTDWQNKNQTF